MRNDPHTSARRRRGARELLVKALYQWQLAGHGEAELRQQFETTPEFPEVDQEYFLAVLALVLQDTEALDRDIARQADRSVETTDPVSRAVLLMGLAELHFRRDVPTKVVINESVELAKRYGPAECHRFVNAVLDKAAKRIDGRGA